MIRRRKVVLIGGEGPSELSFVAWLNDRAIENGGRVAFQKIKCQAGNGYTVVKSAVEGFNAKQKDLGKIYGRFLLLDDDKWDGNKHLALRLARENQISLIIFKDNFEAFLGQLFAADPTLGPPRARAFLRQHWNSYEKNSDKTALDQHRDTLLAGLTQYARRDRALRELMMLCDFVIE
ncbi:hypothetical protein [Pacificispira sp.]|uniref:hypothetical protein n=1 Tax=Pacificispira sp. TaxID=2888761 RepID=UPI003BAA305A